MNGKVIPLGGVTRLNLPPDRVLEGAKDHLKDVVIMGYDHDGKEYFASSIADGGAVLWLMERMKRKLFEAADND